MSTNECMEYSQKYASAQGSKDRNEARGELRKQINLTVAAAVAAERERCTKAVHEAIFATPGRQRLSAEILIRATDAAIGMPNVALTRRQKAVRVECRVRQAVCCRVGQGRARSDISHGN